MAEQVILEFVGDPTGLKPLADAMTALGQLTDEQAASLRKATADFATRKAAIVAGEKAAQAAFNATADSISKETTQLDKMSKGLGDISKAIAGGNIKGAADTFKKFGDEVGNVAVKALSLKAQLKAMKNELNTLDEGSARFKKLAVEAAKLEDKIGDVNNQVRTLASDTFALDAVVDGVKGMTAAFSIAQGASALLGGENENLQKALLKINALMLISTSLQELSNQLKGQGAAKTAILTIAEEAYTWAIQGTNTALKVMRFALLATGVGAIIFILYQAAEAFGLFGDEVEKSTTKLDENTEAQKKNNEERAKFGRAALDAAEISKRLAAGIGVGTIATSELKAALSDLQQQMEDFTTDKAVNAQASFNKSMENVEPLKTGEKEIDAYFANLDKNLQTNVKSTDEAAAAALRENEQRLETIRLLEKEIAARAAALEPKQAARQKVDPLITLPFIEAKQIEVTAQQDADAARVESAEQAAKRIDDANKTVADNEAKRQQELADLQDQYRRAAIRATEALVGALFQIQSANLRAQYDAQISALHDQMEAQLANENLTAEQQDAIREQYRKKEADIKRVQFEKEKQAKIIEATIATALAVIKAFGDSGYIGAALAAIEGAAQIAVIASAPTPQFAQGTEYVQGAGTGTSDSIHAKLSKGERVVPADINERLAGIPNSELPRLAAFANMMPNINSDVLQQYERNQSMSIDYGLMANEFSKALAKNPRAAISIDKNGVNILLTRGNQKTNYLNNRYQS